MKNVSVFVLQDQYLEGVVAEYNNKKNILHKTKLFTHCITAAEKQLESLGIDYEIKVCQPQQIPAKIESNLIVFLDVLTFIPDDYFFTVISLNNLYRDAGVFFGPTFTTCDNETKYKLAIKKNYHSYNIDFGGSVVCDITDEDNNYGDLVGSVVTGAAYNRVGYGCCDSPRGAIANNQAFVKQIADTHKIYYCRDLNKGKYLSDSMFNHETVSEYYYHMGYQDGLLLSFKNKASKTKEVWKRFVEAPELLDHEMPRWLFDEKPEDNIDYLELIVTLKCKYNIGLFEAMLGKKLV